MPELKRKIVNGFEHLEIEPGPPLEPIKAIINPMTGDGWRAIDVLEELQGVLAKRGFALLHKPDSIKLVKITGRGPAVVKARIIAEVRELSEFAVEWRDAG